jgi:pyruvate/2-oxoglutarate dehydrogenase complex dihydrolipoamide acyltransferase (E2) component
MTDVLLPILALERPEADGVVATWFVNDGQVATAGQLLAEIQVDKVSQEVPAPVDGVVHLLAAEGDALPQGSAIARIS